MSKLRLCGHIVIGSDGVEMACDARADSWHWYQDVEHEDCLEPACKEHENVGGIRMAELIEDRVTLHEFRQEVGVDLLKLQENCGPDELADAVKNLLDEVDGLHTLIFRQGDLLTAAVNALRGPPPELVTWSHHDVAELAAQAIQERNDARAAVARVRELMEEMKIERKMNWSEMAAYRIRCALEGR